jgi:hypothetical protein
MTLLSRRDVGKILAAGFTGLAIGAQNAWGALRGSSSPGKTRAQSGKQQPPAKSSKGSFAIDPSKRTTEDSEPYWSDVLLTDGPEPMVSYRTGWVVYEESLTRGQFVGRGWNGAGYINFYDGRLDPAEYHVPQAFRLEIDGQALTADWKWGGLEKTPADQGNSHATTHRKSLDSTRTDGE